VGGLARVERLAGNWDAARGWYERAVVAWRPFGRALTAGVLKMVSEVAREQGDLVRAEQTYREALAVYRAQDDRREIAATQCIGGHLALAQGDLAAARERYAESFALRRESPDRTAKGDILEGLALLAAAEGAPEAALTLAGAAAALRQDHAPPGATSRALAARHLDPARRALSPEAQAAATAAGRGMAPEEALACAAAYLARRSP
jgi:tetratricopeptide (TPR) repeat protein